MFIKNKSEIELQLSQSGCMSAKMFERKNSDYAIMYNRLEAGTSSNEHSHDDCDEIYYVTEGAGVLNLGSESREIKAGDLLIIPKGTFHFVHNQGAVPVEFLSIGLSGDLYSGWNWFKGKQTIMLVINVIVPVFGLIGIGFAAYRLNILGRNANRVLSNFVYFLALPSTLFLSGARTQVRSYLDSWPFLLSYFLATAVVFLWIYLRKNQDRKARIVNAMSSASPNTAFMGIPVVLTIFGQKGMLEVIMSTLILSVVVVVSIVLLDAEKEQAKGIEFKKVLSILYKNPLVVSIIAGILFAVFRIELPKCVETLFSYLSATTGTLSLIAIGMTLTLRIPKNMGNLLWISAVKLIAMPIITLILLKLFHASDMMMAAGLVLSSMPVAVTSYIIAQRYNVQVQESSDIVISSTIFSVATLVIIIVVISTFFPGTIAS